MNQLARALAYMMVIPALALTTAGCVPEDEDPEVDGEELGEAEQEIGRSPVVGTGFVHFFATIEEDHDEPHPMRFTSGFALKADGSVSGGGGDVVLGHDGPEPLRLQTEEWFYIDEGVILVCWSYEYLQSGELGELCAPAVVSGGPAPIYVNADDIPDGQYSVKMH